MYFAQAVEVVPLQVALGHLLAQAKQVLVKAGVAVGVVGSDAHSANTFGSGGGGGGLAAPIGSYPNQDGFRAGAGSPGVVIFRFSNTSLFNALTVSAPGATVIRYPGNVVYRFASAGSISW